MSHYRERAAELVAQMTMEEKVSQTLYNAPAIERLGIPAYNWWNEALHGVARAGTATVFPQAIGLAATFDEETVKCVAEAIATEGRAKYNAQKENGDRGIYKGLTFWAPNVNIFRDPRWGRGHETYGEDPYLTSRLGVSFIKGLQGDDPDYLKTAACAKHFAVHSGPEDQRHTFNAVVSKQDLYETYLPAFKACVQEGNVEAVMGAYNRTNGEPCCGSKTLLQEILRDEWGFSGHVVSDCGAIHDFHENHKITRSPMESAIMALENGCDLNCGCIFPNLRDAVRGNYIEEKILDQAVIRLMETRLKLGMFEEEGTVPFDNIPYTAVDSKEHQKLNQDTARKSLVLLKNENNLLPLDKNRLQTIGVIGPNANSRKALIGNYEGTASKYTTVLEGIQEYVGNDVRVFYSEGCHLCYDQLSSFDEKNDRISEVKAVCTASDVIILVMGLDSSLEGEEGDTHNLFASGDKMDLNYPGMQKSVIKTAYESGKPVILVSMTGSAMAMSWEEEHLPAIIQAWYPGAEGGKAVADLIFGEYSPEGKLPVTFYHTTEELPAFTDYAMKDRTYRYMKQEALYPFGYGLSYTAFELTDIKNDSDSISQNGKITLSAQIQNTGKIAGAECVQVYVKSLCEDTPNAQLKGLKKVYLQPGEEQKITFELKPEAFALYNEDGKFVLRKGEYNVYIGTQQPDKRSEELTHKKSHCIHINCYENVLLS